MILTVANVILRDFFEKPIMGTPELSEFMMVLVVFLALAWCAITRKHVKVELFTSRFSTRTQAILNGITLILALGIYIVITWQSALESMAVYDTTSLLRIPHTPFYWSMTSGLGLFCLSILVLIIENIIEARKR
jgi:TRAP-type C4-dicarboxylate transport system permease small subunit